MFSVMACPSREADRNGPSWSRGDRVLDSFVPIFFCVVVSYVSLSVRKADQKWCTNVSTTFSYRTPGSPSFDTAAAVSAAACCYCCGLLLLLAPAATAAAAAFGFLLLMSVSGGLNVLRVGMISQTLPLSYPVAVRVVAAAASSVVAVLRSAAAVRLLLYY